MAFIGAVLIGMGFWLFIGNPAMDPEGRYLGATMHAFFEWLTSLRPYSTIISFILGAAAFMMIKKR